MSSLTRRGFLRRAGTLAAAAAADPWLLPAPAARRPASTYGLFFSFHYLPRPAEVQAFKDLVLAAGANTIVVDIKNPWGYVNVPVEHPLRGRPHPYLEDPRPLQDLLAWAARHRLYAIARQVVMMDGQLARYFPRYALADHQGDVWRDLTHTPWANPFDPAVADYNAAIAEAAVQHLGFRQVQFDLIRFPSGDSDIESIKYARRNTRANRVAAIAHCLQLAHERLSAHGGLLSADLLGYAAFEYQGDLGVGQDLEALAPHVDGVSPMAYPSLYPAGILSEACPDQCRPGLAYPYEIVKLTVRHARRRLRIANPAAFVEPWIQAYPPAGAREVQLQQHGAFDAGAAGILAWHTNFRGVDPLVFMPSRTEALRGRAPATAPE